MAKRVTRQDWQKRRRVGEQIRAWRVANDMTQAELAATLGVLQAHVSKAERGILPLTSSVVVGAVSLIEQGDSKASKDAEWREEFRRERRRIGLTAATVEALARRCFGDHVWAGSVCHLERGSIKADNRAVPALTHTITECIDAAAIGVDVKSSAAVLLASGVTPPHGLYRALVEANPADQQPEPEEVETPLDVLHDRIEEMMLKLDKIERRTRVLRGLIRDPDPIQAIINSCAPTVAVG